MASGTVELGIKIQMRNVFNLLNLHVTSLCWMMEGKYDLQINSLLFTHDDFYSCLVHCGSSSLEQKPTLPNKNTNCCVIVLCSLSKSLASTFPFVWEGILCICMWIVPKTKMHSHSQAVDLAHIFFRKHQGCLNKSYFNIALLVCSAL